MTKCKDAFRQDPPIGQNIDSCICNGLRSTEPGKLYGTNLSFQMNHTSICWAMIVVLDIVPVKADFKIVLLNNIVAEHPELCTGRVFA